MPERRITILGQLVPPKATWTAKDVPDQSGKTVIITGGHIGVGKETARELLSKGAKVYIATRFEEKAQAAIDELKRDTKKESVFFLKLDLADLHSIKAAAGEFTRKESDLHTLYNNSGITYAPAEKVTEQGYDIVFGTNVLGHFYLTKLLLPALTATAKKSPDGTVRVINMSSLAHYMAASEGIRWATLGPKTDASVARRRLGKARVFGQSKLGNILFSNEFARRYGDRKIVSISLFSGAVNADLQGYAGSFFHRAWRLMGACICFIVSGGDLEALTEDIVDKHHPTSRGIRAQAEAAAQRPVLPQDDDDLDSSEPAKVDHRAITSLFAGTATQAGRMNGKYLTAWARVTRPSDQALNTRLAKELWDWLEERVKGDFKVEEEVENDAGVNEVIEIREGTNVEELTKVKPSTEAKEITEEKGDSKPEDVTKVKEDTKPEEETKAKEDTEAKE